MAFKKSYGKKNGNKSNYTSVRLTGMFKTKKPGMYVGNLRKEDLEALIGKIKEAKADGKSLVFFLFRNQDKEADIAFSLLADSKDEDRNARKSKKSNRIEEDDDAEVEEESEDEEGGEDAEESEDEDL